MPLSRPALSAVTSLSLYDVTSFAVQNAQEPDVSIGFNHLTEVQTALMLQYIETYIKTKRTAIPHYSLTDFCSDLHFVLSTAYSNAEQARKRFLRHSRSIN